jgi:hypothetical protein
VIVSLGHVLEYPGCSFFLAAAVDSGFEVAVDKRVSSSLGSFSAGGAELA